MTTFTWLHLSDLHLRGTESSIDRDRFSEMLKNIGDCLKEEHLRVDAVFFTGDITFSGQTEQYKLAGEWFDRILDTCGILGEREKLFIVPGNHDVDRTALKEPDYLKDEKGRTTHERFASSMLDPNRDYEEITRFLGDDEYKKWAFRKFENFWRFNNEFFGSVEDTKLDHAKYYSVRGIKKNAHIIPVIGFNSAWLSFRDDGEQGKLLLGARQILDASEESEKKWPEARLRIALVHHPVYWLAEKDIHEVQKYLPQRCQFVLRGHLHCPSYSLQSTPDSRLREFAAGASLKANYHAYNLVTVDLETGKGTAFVRVQHPELGARWVPDSHTYHNVRNGKIEFHLALDASDVTTEA